MRKGGRLPTMHVLCLPFRLPFHVPSCSPSISPLIPARIHLGKVLAFSNISCHKDIVTHSPLFFSFPILLPPVSTGDALCHVAPASFIQNARQKGRSDLLCPFRGESGRCTLQDPESPCSPSRPPSCGPVFALLPSHSPQTNIRLRASFPFKLGLLVLLPPPLLPFPLSLTPPAISA